MADNSSSNAVKMALIEQIVEVCKKLKASGYDLSKIEIVGRR